MAVSWKSFFSKTKQPDDYDGRCAQINSFIKENTKTDTKVVLVTSGGTAVPLESKTVRFIDNFSVGTRGATSAEYFLQHGYAVIFLHRRGSLEPFKRTLNKFDILNLLEFNDGDIKVKPDYHEGVSTILKAYQSVQREGRLCPIPFSTLGDYLYLLKAAAIALADMNNKAMFYLAAAVSDFYIPVEEMPEHKIQSSNGPLQISLQLVPKMLEPLVSEWAPNAFTVSFKLETDPSLLVMKSRKALDKYKHQIVISNLLETRKQEVILITCNEEQKIALTDEEMAKGIEIESRIIPQLIQRHSAFYS